VLRRRDQVLALVGDVPDRERQHGAVGAVRERQVHDAAGRLHERGETLPAVLEELHRTPGATRQQRADEQVRRPPLVAEAAPDVRGGEADARLRHAERLGQDRHRQSRPLVVRPEREAIRAGIPGRDAAERLEWRGGVAAELEALLQHTIGPREGAVHVAVGQRVVPEDVGAELGVEQRRLAARAGLGVHRRRQRPPLDPDEVDGVLGGGPIDGSDGGDGLAHEPRAVDRQAPVAHRRRRGDAPWG
jgi:hypothetical protein